MKKTLHDWIAPKLADFSDPTKYAGYGTYIALVGLEREVRYDEDSSDEKRKLASVVLQVAASHLDKEAPRMLVDPVFAWQSEHEALASACLTIAEKISNSAVAAALVGKAYSIAAADGRNIEPEADAKLIGVRIPLLSLYYDGTIGKAYDALV